jgi:prepilin-type N-terminal cleavage/methylation domain-containing protein
MNRIRQILGSDRSASADDGFTLVEVIVAMVVFSIIAVSVAAAITNSLVITRDARSRSVAQNLASQDLDQARAVADVFAVQSNTWSTTVQGTSYTVDRSVEWQSSATSATACGTGTGTLQYKVVRDSVTWPGSPSPVVSSTVLAPNSRINDPTLGTIVVAVQGASGSGESGVNVSIVPTSGNANGAVALAAQPAQTDANGCTYALKVTPGNYTVTVSMANGVDINQVTTPYPNKPAIVTAGTATPVTFNYDVAAQLPLQYASNYNGSALLPSNLPVTFSNSISGDDALPLNGSTTANLFPFASGYTYEAGTYVAPGGTAKSCVDVDPGAWTTPNAAGKVGVSSYATTASGGNPSAGVRMGVVSLPQMTPALGGLAGGIIPLVATSINASTSGDPGCQTGVSYLFTTKAGSPSLALPFGTYRLYAGTSLTPVVLPAGSVKTGGTINPDGSFTLDPRGVTP